MSLKQLKNKMEQVKKIIMEVNDEGLCELEDLTGTPVAEQQLDNAQGYIEEAVEERYDPQMTLGQAVKGAV